MLPRILPSTSPFFALALLAAASSTGCGDDIAAMPSTDSATSGSDTTDGSSADTTETVDTSASDTEEVETTSGGESSDSSTGDVATECSDSTDCRPTGEGCSMAECVDGQCTSTPRARGSAPQGECDGVLCDGDGNCVECIADPDCQIATCEFASCESGVCVATDDPSQDCQPMEGLRTLELGAMVRLDPETGLLASGDQSDLDTRTVAGISFEFAAIHPDNGRIYSGSRYIDSLDPEDGYRSRLARSPSRVHAKTFDEATGQLWGVLNGGLIVTIDVETGLQSPVVQTNFIDVMGIPFDVEPLAITFTENGELYGLLSEVISVGMYSIDLETGVAVRVAGLPQFTHSLVFATDEGVFYSLASNAEELVRIDLENQELQTVAVSNLPRTAGLLYDASAQRILGLGKPLLFDNAYSVLSIDRASQTSSLVRHFGVGRPNEFARVPASDDYFVVNNTSELFRVNVENQTFTRLGQVGDELELRLAGIAATPNGAIYAVEQLSDSGEPGQIYRVDPSDGSILATGSIPRASYNSLTYDSATDQLFATMEPLEGPSSPQLLAIDPQTLSSTVLGTISLPGLAYAESTGLLYGLDEAGQLWSVDASTSPPTPTLVGPTEFPNIREVVTDGASISALNFQDALARIDVDTGHTVMDGVPPTVSDDFLAYDPLTRDVAIFTVFASHRRYRWDPWTNTTSFAAAAPQEFEHFVFAPDGTGYDFDVPPLNGGVGPFARTDARTGTRTIIRADFPAVSAAAFDSDGTLYCARQGSLYTVDLETGDLEEVGPTGLEGFPRGMVWDRSAGRLLAITRVDEVATFIEIDPASGEATPLASPIPWPGVLVASH